MPHNKIEAIQTMLGALGLSITTKIGIETFLPMENELISTGIHVVGTVVGGVTTWVVIQIVKRKFFDKK